MHEVPVPQDVHEPTPTTELGGPTGIEAAETAPDPFQQRYAEQRARIEARQVMLQQRIPDITARVARQTEAFREQFGREPEGGLLDSSLTSVRRSLAINNDKLAFLRPSSEADIAYRLSLMDTLSGRIKETAPPELPLRLHGGPLYAARDAIFDGGLSSSVDRLGITTSYDVSDQVSVTTAETVETTVGSYLSLNDEQYCMPPGCIFVLLPQSPEDAASAASMLMRNVHFRENPKQLFGIMTAAENVQRVREWAEANGVDPTKVQEFFDFCKQMGQLKQDIADGVVSAQDFVPYPLQGSSGPAA
jgi:hypothetical protein